MRLLTILTIATGALAAPITPDVARRNVDAHELVAYTTARRTNDGAASPQAWIEKRDDDGAAAKRQLEVEKRAGVDDHELVAYTTARRTNDGAASPQGWVEK